LIPRPWGGNSRQNNYLNEGRVLAHRVPNLFRMVTIPGTHTPV
jgi:hypothetical protein